MVRGLSSKMSEEKFYGRQQERKDKQWKITNG